MNVTTVEQITETVKRFTLTPQEGRHLLPFLPGAHIQTFIATPEGRIQRPYSLCSRGDETKFYQIAVKHHPGSRGGSRFWHEQVMVGTTLEISAPINHFGLSHSARHHVLIAGGIGMTPFLPMLANLAELSASFELHVAAKSASDCPFFDFLQAAYQERVHFYFSSQGHRLHPSVLAGKLVGTQVYICGPQGLMKSFRLAARELGYPDSRISMEAFESTAGSENRPFVVQLERSGITLSVPAEQSLLDVLEDAGVRVPHSCRMGGCGTCELDVLEGAVEHRDFYLTEHEQVSNKTIISCVSRALGESLKLNL